jgi:hypothetical protein
MATYTMPAHVVALRDAAWDAREAANVAADDAAEAAADAVRLTLYGDPGAADEARKYARRMLKLAQDARHAALDAEAIYLAADHAADPEYCRVHDLYRCPYAFGHS